MGFFSKVKKVFKATAAVKLVKNSINNIKNLGKVVDDVFKGHFKQALKDLEKASIDNVKGVTDAAMSGVDIAARTCELVGFDKGAKLLDAHRENVVNAVGNFAEKAQKAAKDVCSVGYHAAHGAIKGDFGEVGKGVLDGISGAATLASMATPTGALLAVGGEYVKQTKAGEGKLGDMVIMAAGVAAGDPNASAKQMAMTFGKELAKKEGAELAAKVLDA